MIRNLLPALIRRLAALAACAVFGLACYFAVLDSSLEEFRQARGSRQQLLNAYLAASHLATHLPLARQQYAEAAAELGKFDAVLPIAAGVEVSSEAITWTIERAAGKFKVRIDGLKFADTRPREFHSERSATFKVYGSFAEVTRFLHELTAGSISTRQIREVAMRRMPGAHDVWADVRLDEFAYVGADTVAALRREKRGR